MKWNTLNIRGYVIRVHDINENHYFYLSSVDKIKCIEDSRWVFEYQGFYWTTVQKYIKCYEYSQAEELKEQAIKIFKKYVSIIKHSKIENEVGFS